MASSQIAAPVCGYLDNLTSVLGDVDKEDDKDMDKEEGGRLKLCPTHPTNIRISDNPISNHYFAQTGII